jgi:hypothetical protein
MKIALTLDGLISSENLSKYALDDDLFCLNQVATEDGWYSSTRWFLSGNDVFFITSRSNQVMTDRWLDEWNLMYNKIIYDIPHGYHYNTAIALNCDIFITPCSEELPKHEKPEILSFFYSREPSSAKVSSAVNKISHLNDIDMAMEQWGTHQRKSNVRIVGQSRTLPT